MPPGRSSSVPDLSDSTGGTQVVDPDSKQGNDSGPGPDRVPHTVGSFSMDDLSSLSTVMSAEVPVSIEEGLLLRKLERQNKKQFHTKRYRFNILLVSPNNFTDTTLIRRRMMENWHLVYEHKHMPVGKESLYQVTGPADFFQVTFLEALPSYNLAQHCEARVEQFVRDVTDPQKHEMPVTDTRIHVCMWLFGADESKWFDHEIFEEPINLLEQAATTASFIDKSASVSIASLHGDSLAPSPISFSTSSREQTPNIDTTKDMKQSTSSTLQQSTTSSTSPFRDASPPPQILERPDQVVSFVRRLTAVTPFLPIIYRLENYPGKSEYLRNHLEKILQKENIKFLKDWAGSGIKPSIIPEESELSEDSPGVESPFKGLHNALKKSSHEAMSRSPEVAKFRLLSEEEMTRSPFVEPLSTTLISQLKSQALRVPLLLDCYSSFDEQDVLYGMPRFDGYPPSSPEFLRQIVIESCSLLIIEKTNQMMKGFYEKRERQLAHRRRVETVHQFVMSGLLVATASAAFFLNRK